MHACSQPKPDSSTAPQASAEKEQHVAMSTPKTADPKSPEPVRFAYNNMSYFHQDGENLWVGVSGKAVVQIAKRSQHTVDKRYRFQIEDPALLKELDEVTAFKGDLVVTERLGIPDEVSVSFGYLHEDGRYRHLRVWEKDASKQNSDVKRLLAVYRQIIVMAQKHEPFYSVEKPESLEFWPEEFAPLPKPPQ